MQTVSMYLSHQMKLHAFYSREGQRSQFPVQSPAKPTASHPPLRGFEKKQEVEAHHKGYKSAGKDPKQPEETPMVEKGACSVSSHGSNSIERKRVS